MKRGRFRCIPQLLVPAYVQQRVLLLALIPVAALFAACQDVAISAPAGPAKKDPAPAAAPATPVKVVSPSYITRPALLETTFGSDA